MLFLSTFILVTAGAVSFLKTKKKESTYTYKLFFFMITIFGIMPAAIATEVPHSNRALLALIGFIVLAVYGLDYIIELLRKTKLNKKVLGSHKENDILINSFVGTLLALHILFFVSFISHYFTRFDAASTDAFNHGYLEAFQLAEMYEKGEGTDPVDKIIFSSKYGQPYIYALFVRETNPIWYRGGSLVKYEFHDEITINDLSRSNTLVVGSGSDDTLPTEKADHVIFGADGSVRFQVFRTRK